MNQIKDVSILVIEDEPQIRRFVRSALEAEGAVVHEADSLKRGLIEAGMRKPDLVVLGLGLPDGDGKDLIRDLRGWSSVPVIILSARGAEEEKIAALDLGADDYLSKPFGVGELLARVRVALRRHFTDAAGKSEVEFGVVRVDLGRRVVTRGGEEVHLTPIEFRLLAYLVAHAGKVLTHHQILKEVWDLWHAESAHYVRIYTAQLCQKLEDDPARHRHFLTEMGVGYRLSA
ncbi:MAG: two-component system response regulator KdpE [Candidatus Protistobacter heckmanni]|nr:two-component system response regulator KdpE [Candidatus Protistobacter heckmanni]